MPETAINTRVEDRRKEDKDCRTHESRLDTIDKDVAGNKGWLKGVLAVVTFVAAVLSFFGTTILSELTNIKTMIGKNDVTMGRMDEKVQSHEQRIKDIETRHIFLDQNGIVIKKGNRQ